MKTKIKMLSKIKYNYIIYLLLILFLIIYIYLYFTKHYMYLVGNDLQNESQLIFDGDIVLDDPIDIKIDSNNLFGPFRNKEIKIDNINENTNIKYVYNIFEFTGFEPFQTYDVKFEMNIVGLDNTTNLIVGTEQTKAENRVEEDTGTIINNIELKDATRFSKGYTQYLSTPISFEANENGAIYIVVGIEVGEKKVLDYDISKVRLVL